MTTILRIAAVTLIAFVCMTLAKDICLKVKIASQCNSYEKETYCKNVTASSCPAGTQFLAGAGYCSCDVCIKYVGEGDACVIGGYTFPFCSYPWRCNTNHVCVNDCSYS